MFKDGSGTVQDGHSPTTVRVHIPIDKERLAPGEVVPAELTLIADDLTLLVQQGTSSQLTVDTADHRAGRTTAAAHPVTRCTYHPRMGQACPIRGW
jgi:hypothetical protein